MHTVIRKSSGWQLSDLRELWAYRELLAHLAWRDVSIRYRQTVIGATWAFLRPLITMLVFTVVFGKLAGLPSGTAPYAVMTFTALLPWQFFASGFSESAGSIVGNGHMVGKIYFPRLILPLSSLSVAATDFAVSFGVLVLLMAGYRVAPPLQVLWLPAFMLLAIAFTAGLSIWLSAVYVRYRDLRHLIPFITQIGLYVSPVAFSSTVIPERWRLLYSLNPMVGVIDGFRWSLLGSEPLYVPGLIASVVTTVALLVAGVAYFKRYERRFADFM